MGIRTGLSVLVLGGLVWYHCGGSDTPGKPCGDGCGPGQYCDTDGCKPCTDTDDRHCGINCIDCTQQASNKACVAGTCGCQTDADCASGEPCMGGVCGCDADCEGKCGGASDGCGGTCTDDCPTGQWCDGQTCTACDVNQHCGQDGQVCADCTGQSNNRVCVSRECGCNGDADCMQDTL